jgi:serine/threonine-protein kinase
VAIAVIVLTVLGSGWWVGVGRYTDAPPLLNITRAQAQGQADRAGFELIFTDGTFSETAAKDVVLSQQPPPESRIVRGGTITLALSLGPERYPVPDITAVELSGARGELEAVKLVLKEGRQVFNDILAKGIVVSSDPPAGTRLRPGEVVTVTVSKGKAPITVPDLNGKNINEARGTLAQLGLNAVEQYQDSDQPADTVIGQSPDPNTGVGPDTEIKLQVSKGPPQVTVPRVLDLPCQQAKQQLEGSNLRVRVDLNPNGIVRAQNPAENTPVAPQTEVAIQCL